MSGAELHFVSNDTPAEFFTLDAEFLASKSNFFPVLLDFQPGGPGELHCPASDFRLLLNAWGDAASVANFSLSQFSTLCGLCERFQNTDEKVISALR